MFFANSGAEANECAIKLARRYGQANGGPERFHVLSAYGSFHGRTLTTLAATGQPQKQETFQPLPAGFRQVVFADVDALAAAMDERVCAVMLEPVQGEGGVQPSPPGYLEAVRALCDEREALLIIDEVQTGLGRTGRWFGFQHADDVRPDIVTMAKALGNGVPIGACWARTEVAEAFQPGDHATTFGGQPLAARAALAVLDVMEPRSTRPRARPRRASGSPRRCSTLPGVADVRGVGPADRRRARRRASTPGRSRARASTPGSSSTRSRRPRCGSRRRCSSPTTRSPPRSPSSPRCSQEVRA